MSTYLKNQGLKNVKIKKRPFLVNTLLFNHIFRLWGLGLRIKVIFLGPFRIND